ncbi:MAG: ABC-type transport system involved in cytochrome bd biosynthesis fused ATPase/permease subunit, partial [Flavobacteriaceae bacterium]
NITDKRIKEVFTAIGLIDFLAEQINGLNTYLKPEGKQISYTISKKIILARAILKSPKVLILEDPIDQFSKEESQIIIEYLTNTKQTWSLVVVSANVLWEKACSQIITLENGKIK